LHHLQTKNFIKSSNYSFKNHLKEVS